MEIGVWYRGVVKVRRGSPGGDRGVVKVRGSLGGDRGVVLLFSTTCGGHCA